MSRLTLDNTAIVVDSTCDPPPGYFDQYDSHSGRWVWIAHGGYDFGVAVSHVHHAYPAGEVDELSALDVGDGGVSGTGSKKSRAA